MYLFDKRLKFPPSEGIFINPKFIYIHRKHLTIIQIAICLTKIITSPVCTLSTGSL